MANRSRNWICFLAIGIAAGLNVRAASSAVLGSIKLPLGQNNISHAGYEGYHDDDDFYYPPPEYYVPPPPRIYRYAPPPATYYEPPAYEWIPPPRPASCGRYRYWNGEYCADARYRPPYVGPRW